MIKKLRLRRMEFVSATNEACAKKGSCLFDLRTDVSENLRTDVSDLTRMADHSTIFLNKNNEFQI